MANLYHEGSGGSESRPPDPAQLRELSRMGQAVLLRTSGALAEITPVGVARTAYYDLSADTVVSISSASGDVAIRITAASWINKHDKIYRLDHFLACYAPERQTRLYSDRIEIYMGGRQIEATSQAVAEVTDDLLIDAIVAAHDLETKYDDDLSAVRLERFTRVLQYLDAHPDPSEIFTADFLPAIIADEIRRPEPDGD